MLRLAKPDEGTTLIAVVIILFVVTVIGTASLQMALHANDATTMDRQRLQSVQAAEAAANEAIDRLSQNSACDTSAWAAQNLVDGSDIVAKYQARIDPDAGTICGDTLKRVVNAWGYAPAESERSLRHLVVEVQLIPTEGFQFTLFASGNNGIVTVKNTGTIDGDIYAENLDQTKNNVNADMVVTPGSIDTQNNAIYSSTLWAGGDITLRQNGQVGGSLLAAGSNGAGNILMENGVRVAKDVKAAGTVTLPTTYTIDGSLSQNNPNIPPPPVLDRPTFTWDPTDYSPAPTTYSSASDMEAGLDAIKNDLKGTHYVNAPSSTVSLPTNATVTGPLTIVTTGKLDLGRSMSASGGPHQVVLVATQTGQAAINVDQPASFSSDLDVLLFTRGQVNLKNQITMRGAIYADEILIKNSVTVQRSDSLASSPPVGFDFTQASAARFTVVPTLWRELDPGSPPS